MKALYPIILKTQRLFLREFTPQDTDNLFKLLSDPEVMRYYPKTLDRKESQEWLEQQFSSYQQHGFGWWAVHLQETQDFIGQAGFIVQRIREKEEPGLGYMIHQPYWGQGYAFEGAKALIAYGFHTLHFNHIICTVRPENTPSNAVAKKLGFHIEDTITYKRYTHYLYTLT